MTPSDDKRTKQRQADMVEGGLLLGSGLQFAVTIMIATIGGWWLDEKLSTSPLLLIAGMLFGATAAFYHLYRMLTRPDTDDAVASSQQDPQTKGEEPE